MNEYAPASGQDRNYYSNPHLVTPHYTNGNGLNYFYPNGHLQYPSTSSYASYPTQYMSTNHQNPSAQMYNFNSNPTEMPYQLTPPLRPYQQPRTQSYPPNAVYHPGTVPTQRAVVQHSHRNPYGADLCITNNELEGQESVNEATMLSEPILPPLEGYPDVKTFDRLMREYVEGLSPKKQDKALIHARRARNIRTVLQDTKTTSVESAQFRFWVKKMFSLQQIGPNGAPKSICHERKPVAIREKLFKILTKAHKDCQHGGRDKTSSQVRRVYSWVPKELISRFVKMCPTCKIRRPSQRDVDIGDDEKNSPEDDDDELPVQRRGSVATSKRGSVSLQSPMSVHGFSSTFAQQNRWMSDLPTTKSKSEFYDTMSPSHYPLHDSSGVTLPQYTGRMSSHLNSIPYSTSDVSMAGMTSPTGFPSSNLRTTGNWHNSAYSSAYPIKSDRHGDSIKQEHHY